MIPFICHFAAGVYGKGGADLHLSNNEIFEKARYGGWSDDADDPGGPTMIDVTLATYTVYRRRLGLPTPSKDDLRNITYDEWRHILSAMYWDAWCANEIESQGLANILVDWVWSSGRATIKRVQRLLNVKADGVVGPVTLGAVNEYDSNELFAKVMNVREDYCRRCRGSWKYLSGWLRRLHALRPDGTFLIYGKIIGENT